MDRVRPGRVRLIVGAVVGLGLLALTLAQVDVARTAELIGAASPVLLGLALAVVLLDLVLRALRWQALLRGAGAAHTNVRLAVAYLTVGYSANQLLPARLGDVARAYLAGQAFVIPRLAALGTIVVERLADGSTMLALALASTVLASGVAVVVQLSLLGVVLFVGGLLGFGIGWWLVARTQVGHLRLARALSDVVARVAVGMGGMLTPTGAASLILGTLAVATTAVLIGWLAAAAIGIVLSPPQAVLFISAVALSLAIPAAPAAIGTFEFVGVMVLTSFGFPAEQALAAVLLLRVVASLPPVLIGIASIWALHLRTTDLIEPGRWARVATIARVARS